MDELKEVVGVRVNELRDHLIRDHVVVEAWQRRAAIYRAPGEYVTTEEWTECRVHDVWGMSGQTVFLRASVLPPERWLGGYVALQLRTGGEGLLSIDGRPYHGVDDNREYITLAVEYSDPRRICLDIELKPGDYWTWRSEGAVGSEKLVLDESRLILIDKAAEAAYHDFRVVFETAEAVRDAHLRETLLWAAQDALRGVDFRDLRGDKTVEELRAARERLRDLCAAQGFGTHPATFFYTGHSHIDLAWMWPLRETMRKVGRTYSTLVRLMEEYPDYCFNVSQPPLLEYTKEAYPDLYARLQKLAQAGRIEPVGGTWVEHDANIPSGESLVRQCLYGQRYFEREFGKRCRVGWLPDVFGYSWSLPQIYRGAGIDYFVTSKISWNDTNDFPYGSFHWEGIDGSRLLSHFICGSYNANLEPEQTLGLWEDYPSKRAFPVVLSAFGWGDGGGGPTRTMLETIRRHNQTPGLPKSRIGRVEDFFVEMERSAQELPTWNGELYLELCRGTYTSQAENKRWNRVMEGLLHDAEFGATVAWLLGDSYPRAVLEQAWKDVLLNQFHDILPGSSIDEVHEESWELYLGVASIVADVRDSAFDRIRDHVGLDANSVVVFNTLPWARSGIVTMKIPESLRGTMVDVRDADGRGVPASVVQDDTVRFLAREVPAMGLTRYALRPVGATAAPDPGAAVAHNGEDRIEVDTRDGRVEVHTPHYEAVLEANGTFTSLRDMGRDRQVVAADGRLNQLLFFEDKPERYEAWNIDVKYRERAWEPTVVEPLRVTGLDDLGVTMTVRLAYGDSIFNQTIVLYADSPLIDVRHVVEWVQRKTLCKVAFPVRIHAHRTTYEIAYGTIERPMHANTSWDRARYEVPGFRWADLSEADYGVSVVNDSKYGWDVYDGALRLTLLRGTEYPAKRADLGRHEFRYGILPHGGAALGETVRRAQEFNLPMHVLEGAASAGSGRLPDAVSFFRVRGLPVVLDAVKLAEDADDVILRFYEPIGARGRTTVETFVGLDSAWEANMLEDKLRELPLGEGEVELSFRPFEVKTVRLRPVRP